MIDINIWKETFVTDEFLNKIRLYITKQTEGKILTTTTFKDISHTPREIQIKKHKTVSLVPFYYIDYILKNSTSDKIFDIGCGCNFFKNFYNVTGYDQTNEADVKCLFDEEFVEQNKNKLDNAIAINSLHFININRLCQRIQDFYSVVVPDGYGYISLNMQRLLTRTPEADINWAFDFVKEQIENTGIDFISVYVDNTTVDEYIDGNIRLLFKKEKNL